MGDPSKRDQYAAQLKTYASKIASVKFHDDSFSDIICTNDNCQSNLSESHTTICTNQDLRNLRCAKGSTTLEDKNILKCDKCEKAYTSDELATIAVDKQLNIDLSQVVSATEQQSLNVDTLWTTGTTLSKRAIIMELKLMNDMIRQMRELVPIPDFEDPRYKKILFFTNAFEESSQNESYW